MKTNQIKIGLLLLAVAIGTITFAGPAVRLADGSAHGGSVIDIGLPHVPNVFINNIAAVVVGANHVCPLVTPSGIPVPHIGGPIISGSTKVFIGGIPVAIDGSQAICTGPPDTILGGSPNVFINQ